MAKMIPLQYATQCVTIIISANCCKIHLFRNGRSSGDFRANRRVPEEGTRGEQKIWPTQSITAIERRKLIRKFNHNRFHGPIGKRTKAD